MPEGPLALSLKTVQPCYATHSITPWVALQTLSCLPEGPQARLLNFGGQFRIPRSRQLPARYSDLRTWLKPSTSFLLLRCGFAAAANCFPKSSIRASAVRTQRCLQAPTVLSYAKQGQQMLLPSLRTLLSPQEPRICCIHGMPAVMPKIPLTCQFSDHQHPKVNSMLRNVYTFICFSLCAVIAASAQDPTPIIDVRKQDLGSTVVKVAGRVSAANEFGNPAYIQDGTAGIAVFNAAFARGVQIGDSVIIENAEIVEFQATTGQPGTGLLELAGTNMTFTVVPVPRVAPTPRNTSVPLLGEGLEGQLVRIRRLKFSEKGAFQGENNYTAFDTQGNDLAVRIDGSTEIAVQALPIPEDEVDIVGCVSQFRGGYQILPRFGADVGVQPAEPDTVPKNRTLDITSWNLDWYGSTDTTMGPSDKQRQRRSIRQVMDTIQADIWALQEVIGSSAAQALADSIQGSYGVLYSTEMPSEMAMCYLYNKNTITPITNGLAVNGGAQAWAGGRFPYRVTFDAEIDGMKKRYVLFNIHAKATGAGTELDDYERRKTDAETFHAYLHDFYSDSSLMIVGDFNDRLTGTNVDEAKPSPYKVFTDDSTRWFPVTLSLEERGLGSYIGFDRSFIDHCLISRDIKNSLHRVILEAPQAYLSSYRSTVSDHLPVTTRLFVSGQSPVTETAYSNHTVRVAPNPVTTDGMAEVTINVPGYVRVALSNQQGITTTLLQDHCAPQIKLVRIPVATLSSGVYRLIVDINGSITTTPVVIAR
ncbi:MAG: hypothetical protein D8M52_02040 [Chlorobi bacterium]|nr:hypothetical protein [Chlorobiota bacterium]